MQIGRVQKLSEGPPLITVAVLRETDEINDAEAERVVSALQSQVREHFGPAWGIEAQIMFVTGGPPRGAWWLVLLNDTDQADALGYHDLTDEGMPLGKVFLRSCAKHGLSWSVTASHETLEMLADPDVNLTVLRETSDGEDSELYSYEVCDPCEADEFGYEISSVRVSDFAFPAWFESFHKRGVSQFDYYGRISEPFQLLAGGYASVRRIKTKGDWIQKNGDDAFSVSGRTLHSRRALGEQQGSRRERRIRNGRILSDAAKLPAQRRSRSQVAAGPRFVMHASGLVFPSQPAGGAEPIRALSQPSDVSSPLVVTNSAELKPVALEIQKALSAISPSAAKLPNSDAMLRTLNAALKQVTPDGAKPSTTLNGAIPDSLEASLVLSALNGSTGTPHQIRTLDLVGTEPYELLDPKWTQSLYNRLVSERVPFPNHLEKGIDPCVKISNRVTVAIAGDWGTGNVSSRNIANRIADLKPDHTIHLGDVYYSGSDDEERDKFLEIWPAGTHPTASCFALNGNHEMYSGGEGLFSHVLTDSRFQAQQGLSYFALVNDNWVLIGLDSAYYAQSFTYQRGFLDQVQLGWLRETARSARSSSKRVIVLTHHQGIDLDPDKGSVSLQQPLWDQVTHAIEGGPDYWYWGHVHGAIAFAPVAVDGGGSVHARCVGHGGVPYVPYKDASGYGVKVAWDETEVADDGAEPRRALNGFLLLSLDAAVLRDEFRDENGAVRKVLP